MIDAFEKESKQHERRALRQRQMRLMEEAAAGVVVGGVDEERPRDNIQSLNV